jgi:hypothetical protein
MVSGEHGIFIYRVRFCSNGRANRGGKHLVLGRSEGKGGCGGGSVKEA